MTLYEIDEQLKVLEEYQCDMETGEILSDEEFAKKFDEIQMALSDKIENTICFTKNLDAEIEAFKTEEKKIAERRKAKENLSNRLKNNIDRYIRMQYTNMETGEVDNNGLNKFKFETPKMKLSYRKSTTVNVTDQTKVPKEFIKVETKESVDKMNLKKWLKNENNKCDGANLVDNINMQIK